ncbi:hypothetical protein E1A91_D04G220900v1 [Gossypium mustelinum]|uniref:Uncharacterized protein n=1 Tax=Gossypium mustelinum TaxID=34275 RepID=A0A5D2VGU3_GOSMU|nr:hypothetical protein E1A91_D04G220900v1 [Gossypium mustelinum]
MTWCYILVIQLQKTNSLCFGTNLVFRSNGVTLCS